MAATSSTREPSSGPRACVPHARPNGSVRPPIAPDRVQVEPDLTVPGHPDIFAIGDTVTIAGPDGNPVPGIAPAAKQQGRYVAAVIKARLGGTTLPPFRYKHAGSLAQIGKRKAVIDFGWIKLTRQSRLVDLGHRPHLFPDRPAPPAQRRAELALGPRPQPARRTADHAGLEQGDGVSSSHHSLRHCEERSDEAIHSSFTLPRMDCFAALAMTAWPQSRPTRHFTSEHPPSAIGRNA